MRLILFVFLIGICKGYFEISRKDIQFDVKSVQCPDGQSSCPDGETCCELESGQYGCCPIPNAVCCNDHLHCCPTGYTCDVEHSRCQKGFDKSFDVVCPGGEMSCSDGETCCQLQSGDYGCCPLPDAVCCNDFSHCCPHGYKCDVEQNKCEKGLSIPWFTKKPANRLNISSTLIKSFEFSSKYSTIQCPDEKSICPEDTTCCPLSNSSYGCCPYAQASCCSDQKHCCAEGYSCDESGSRCIRHLTLTSLIKIDEQICPDGITKCSISSTCCPNKENSQTTYSCCPYAKGVCCGSNGSSCCPFKYICNEQQLSCQLNSTNPLKEDRSIHQCGTSNLSCPFNQTCCQISQSNQDQYACCIHPHGVCCNDGRHCCPKDTKCDLKTGGCISL